MGSVPGSSGASAKPDTFARRAHRRRRLVLCGLICAGTLALAQISVCPECGREAAAHAAQCEHCGAGLQKIRPPVPTVREPSGEHDPAEHSFLDTGGLNSMGLSAVRADFDLGRMHLEAGRRDLARLFFRNAGALARLTRPDAQSENRRQSIRQHIALAEKESLVRHTCPVCLGTRKKQTLVPTLTGTVQKKEVQMANCPRCGRSGFVMKPRTTAQRRANRREAANLYAGMQAERGRISVGPAWLPAELKGRLTVQAQAKIRRALAEPCAACDGSGESDCANCYGLGEVKCEHCQMGQVSVVTDSFEQKGKLVRSDVCNRCRGRGGLVCQTCKGRGRNPCSVCEGSGERPPCALCAGQGLTPCPTCAGSGQKDDQVCPACAGAGMRLCEGCGGDGRSPLCTACAGSGQKDGRVCPACAGQGLRLFKGNGNGRAR
jgi:hypothetical protein